MSTLASSTASLSTRQKVAGAVVPAASLAALLASWSVYRLAGDVIESVGAGQVITRLLVHVLVAIVPLVVLLVIAVRPPQRLIRRVGFVPMAVGIALLAVVWVPVGMFATFYFGS